MIENDVFQILLTLRSDPVPVLSCVDLFALYELYAPLGLLDRHIRVGQQLLDVVTYHHRFLLVSSLLSPLAICSSGVACSCLVSLLSCSALSAIFSAENCCASSSLSSVE